MKLCALNRRMILELKQYAPAGTTKIESPRAAALFMSVSSALAAADEGLVPVSGWLPHPETVALGTPTEAAREVARCARWFLETSLVPPRTLTKVWVPPPW
eukprot:scaffold94074_cov33-Tisochrysis_lutea.AAC.5